MPWQAFEKVFLPLARAQRVFEIGLEVLLEELIARQQIAVPSHHTNPRTSAATFMFTPL